MDGRVEVVVVQHVICTKDRVLYEHEVAALALDYGKGTSLVIYVVSGKIAIISSLPQQSDVLTATHRTGCYH
jgi:hypothetical protein